MDKVKNEDNQEVLQKIVDLFDTCNEMMDYIFAQNGKEIEAFLQDFVMAVNVLTQSVVQCLPNIIYPNKLKEISDNIPLLAQKLLVAYQNNNKDNFFMRLRCEFRPLFIFWHRTFCFFVIECKDAEGMRRYNEAEKEYCKELAKTPKKDIDREYKYDISVVVLLYGNKEITENCINSIKKYTTNCTYELITCDNGSDEITSDWVRSLPHTKKIHYPINIGSSAAGNTLISYASEYIDGKYLAYISNDVVLTKDWDKILFECMESDASILMSTPVTNSLSNLQTVPVPYAKNDLVQMQKFADKYNFLNRRLWAERARLFPIAGLFRQEEIAKFDIYCSPYFCYDMFADDDISVKAKNSGYKQILCKDVFIHHYGSATIGDGQFDVMDKSRLQFFDKYGFDAWDGMGWDCIVYSQLISSYTQKNASILVFEPKGGESSFALKNRLRELGCDDFVFDAIATDERFIDGMKPIFDSAELLASSNLVVDNKKYDFIMFEGYFEDSKYMQEYVKIAKEHLSDTGKFLIHMRNIFSFENIFGLLSCDDINKRYYKEKAMQPSMGVMSLDTMETFLQYNQFNNLTVMPISKGDGQGKPFLDLVSKTVQIPKKELLSEVIDISSYVIICS